MVRKFPKVLTCLIFISVLSCLHILFYVNGLPSFSNFHYKLSTYFIEIKTGIIKNRFITKTKSQNFTNHSRSQIENKCVIPSLDPYHPSILKYINDKHKYGKCNLNYIAEVRGDRLVVNLTSDIIDAGFYYIRRITDFKVDLSKRIDIRRRDSPLKKGSSGCLMVTSHHSLIILHGEKKMESIIKENVNSKEADVAVEKDTKHKLQCTEDYHFLITNDDHIIHKSSGGCMYLDTARHTRVKFTTATTECKKNSSLFEITKNGKYIKHKESGKCLYYDPDNGSLKLIECDKASEVQFAENRSGKEETVSQKLTEDFIKLEYTKKNGEKKYEFHVFMSKPMNSNEYNNASGLNIIFVMMDSLSNANARRHLRKTYTYLENDANTVILKGHTINGDGTTDQILALLTGFLEKELPETRRGFKNSTTVDVFPFIFEKLHKKGYKTFFSEDDPSVATFNYRLHGFKDPPTTKYMRPWWIAADGFMGKQHEKCMFDHGLKVLKDFLQAFKHDLKFAITMFSNLIHNQMNRAALVDTDLFEFYQYMKNKNHSDNSVIIFFGDHGARAGNIRSTLNGFLEERLPMMSVTVPQSFRKKYNKHFENLKNNGKFLTTHFDMFVTLHNFIDFPSNSFKHKFAKSLLTDIAKQNRDCEMAGISSHYCPCIEYIKLKKTESIAIDIAKDVVSHINRLISNVAIALKLCETLKLKQIYRIRQRKKNDPKYIKIYEVVFNVLPSLGEYEATIKYNIDTSQYTIDSEISRIDFYGDQPKCIAKQFPHLRKFCLCK